METGHSDTTTHGIRVRVGAQYLPAKSDPARHLFTYAYRVVLENVGDERVRLLSRRWLIRDSGGELREVEGPGVVGEYPELAPGETYEYMSGSPLETEWGTMEGSFRFQTDDGEEFDAEIGRFFLAPNVAPIEELLTTEA